MLMGGQIGTQIADARKYLKNIMFWSDQFKPHDYIRSTDALRRAFVIGILQSGKDVSSYRGSAHCRICDERLGYRDMAGWGFIWPEKAEHYVEVHNVWVPGLDDLIEEYWRRNGSEGFRNSLEA